MKPYLATYYLDYGYTDERAAVIVTESAATALGEVLMSYPHTAAEHWTICEIDLNIRSVTEIYESQGG